MQGAVQNPRQVIYYIRSCYFISPPAINCYEITCQDSLFKISESIYKHSKVFPTNWLSIPQSLPTIWRALSTHLRFLRLPTLHIFPLTRTHTAPILSPRCHVKLTSCLENNRLWPLSLKLSFLRIWQMKFLSGNISNVFAQLKVTIYPRLMSHKLIDNGPQALKMVNNPKESHDSGGRCLHWSENLADVTPSRIFVKHFCTTQNSWLFSMPHPDTFPRIREADFPYTRSTDHAHRAGIRPRAIIPHPL